MQIEVEPKREDDKDKEREAIEKRRKQVQQCAVRLFKQIKAGCNKDICFNKYCRKNPYCKDELAEFQDDKAILLHLTKTLRKTKDPEDLMCSNTVSLGAANLEEKSDQQLLDAFDDVYLFCCSFVNKDTLQDADADRQCGVDYPSLKSFFKRVTKHIEAKNMTLH